MNIFWAIALGITSVGIVLLILLMLPLGIKYAQFLGRCLFKLWIPILSCSAVFGLLIAQEFSGASNMVHLREFLASRDFYSAAELAKGQRNLYLLILGLVVLIGVLLISWQVHTWTVRNEALREKLRRPRTD